MGWLARQDGYDPDAFDVPLEQTYDRRFDQTWPGKLAQEAIGAVLAPGRALQSTEPITTEQMIKPAVDLAGLVTGGSYAAPAQKGASGAGIRAYHSSPHDFDKFDLSKIGTGEGAQVYGHGLYFAESPAVSGQGGQYWNQFMRRFEGPEEQAAQYLSLANFDRAQATKTVGDRLERNRQFFKTNPYEFDPARQARLEESFKLLQSDKPVGPRTYEVNINADPAHLLDWDKGLHTQSLEVREMLSRKLGIKSDSDLMRAHDDALYSALTGDPHIKIPNPLPDPTGATIYRDKIGPASVASRQLREAGIPGIKYLDQGSRNATPVLKTDRAGNVISSEYPPPTSNYVIFDPGVIDIMKKYGIAGAAPVGMGALAAQDRYE
jgi:hypothetical protein